MTIPYDELQLNTGYYLISYAQNLITTIICIVSSRNNNSCEEQMLLLDIY